MDEGGHGSCAEHFVLEIFVHFRHIVEGIRLSHFHGLEGGEFHSIAHSFSPLLVVELPGVGRTNLYQECLGGVFVVLGEDGVADLCPDAGGCVGAGSSE